MNWKFSGERPVYQQIMETLRGAIVKGELAPGKKYPPFGNWRRRLR